MNVSADREAELAVLRKRAAALAAAVDVDAQDMEVRLLQGLVQSLAQLAAESVQPPKPQQWVSMPSGQCIPADCVAGGYPALAAAGFRWEGNRAVFPDHWPKVDPEGSHP